MRLRTLLCVRRSRIRVFQRYAGANVRRLRRRTNLTQEELAERAGVDWRTVQDVERARTNLTLAVLVSLADALGVDPRALLRPAPLPPPRTGRPPGSKKSE
jgi:transcriptional regulator with XRE-family HTH domain